LTHCAPIGNEGERRAHGDNHLRCQLLYLQPDSTGQAVILQPRLRLPSIGTEAFRPNPEAATSRTQRKVQLVTNPPVGIRGGPGLKA